MKYYFNENKSIRLYNEDCFDILDKLIENNIKVDMILTDLPYQRTQNKWDIALPFDKMWDRVNKIIKENGCIIFFGQSSFSAKLIMSNEKMYKYTLIWDKVLPSGFLNANRCPLVSHEDILVFYKKLPTYNPQKFKGNKNHSKGTTTKMTNNNYGKFEKVDNSEELGDMKYPRSILTFQKLHPSKMVHPTQKSVELLEYLIKTYTNENELVLDFTMGSGSTLVACKNTNRNGIGIELDEKYYEIAVERIKEIEKNI